MPDTPGRDHVRSVMPRADRSPEISAVRRRTPGTVSGTAPVRGGRSTVPDPARPSDRAFGMALSRGADPTAGTVPPVPLPAPPGLSGIDLAILRLVADGWPNRSIGPLVYWSSSDVGARLTGICRTLGTRVREHAAARGVLHRLVTEVHLTGLPVIKPSMTPADQRVLSAVVTGGTIPTISEDLGLSPHTVRDSRRWLLAAFGARNIAHLAAGAVLLGFVPCQIVDPRFPDIPFTQLPAHQPMATGGTP